MSTQPALLARFNKAVVGIETKSVAAAFALALGQQPRVWIGRSKGLMAATYAFEETRSPGKIDLDLLQRRAMARALGAEDWAKAA